MKVNVKVPRLWPRGKAKEVAMPLPLGGSSRRTGFQGGRASASASAAPIGAAPGLFGESSSRGAAPGAPQAQQATAVAAAPPPAFGGMGAAAPPEGKAATAVLAPLAAPMPLFGDAPKPTEAAKPAESELPAGMLDLFADENAADSTDPEIKRLAPTLEDIDMVELAEEARQVLIALKRRFPALS